MGFTNELRYPSHVVSRNIVTLGEQSVSVLIQTASNTLHVKNGNQQIKNAPKTEKKYKHQNISRGMGFFVTRRLTLSPPTNFIENF